MLLGRLGRCSVSKSLGWDTSGNVFSLHDGTIWEIMVLVGSKLLTTERRASRRCRY